MEVRVFIKFGAKEHLEKMQREGIFYCNTITYFTKIEDEHRGDTFESVTKLNYIENTILDVKTADDPLAEWKKLNVAKMLVKEYYSEPMGNLFCMSAFRMSPSKEVSIFHFDERFLNFGYALMILRQDLFIQRLEKALSELNFEACSNTVEYLDLNKHSGKKSLFQKDINYSWQEEFRIILYTNKYEMNDPFEFSIGSIEGISEIIDLKKTKSLHYKL